MTDLTVYFELAELSFPLQNEMRFKIKLKLDFMKILLHLCTLEYINSKMLGQLLLTSIIKPQKTLVIMDIM